MNEKITNSSRLHLLFIIIVTFFTIEAFSKEEEIVHMVKNGDTLWSISKKYLENPFLWANIWGKNSNIKNPHRIYPGNRIIIIKGEGGETTIAIEKDGKTIPIYKAKPQTSEFEENTNMPASSEIKTSSDAKILSQDQAYQLVRDSVKSEMIANEEGKDKIESKKSVKAPLFTMIFEEDVKYLGMIVDSKEGKLYFTYDDIVFLKIDKKENVARGDILSIVKEGNKIIDIFNKKKFLGNQIYKVGELKILGEINKLQGGLYECKIIKSFEPVKVGHQVLPHETVDKTVTLQPPVKEISGLIIGSEIEQNMFSNNDIIYINRGILDGISEGDTFIVPVDAPYRGMGLGIIPQIIVAKISVVEAYKNMSICIVSESTEGIRIGYKFQTSLK